MKNSIRLLQLIVLCWFLVGCASHKYIERKQYLLDTSKNLVKKNITGSSGCSIFIKRVTALAPFDRLDFLYRVKESRYLIDYYNGFLVLPAEQLDAILRSYLRIYTDCDLEATQSSGTPSFLQVNLVELYADYRKTEEPQAVIALQFYLTTSIADKNVVLLDRVLRVSQPLKAKDSEGLLSAWNEGMQDVMIQAAKILNQKLKERK